MVLQNIKNCKSLQEFKRLIKVWKREVFPSRMCKKYVANIGHWLHLIKHTPFIEPKQRIQTFMLMEHINHYSFLNLCIIHNQEN